MPVHDFCLGCNFMELGRDWIAETGEQSNLSLESKKAIRKAYLKTTIGGGELQQTLCGVKDKVFVTFRGAGTATPNRRLAGSAPSVKLVSTPGRYVIE